MSIQDFITQTKTEFETAYRNQSASEVLLKSIPRQPDNWQEILSKGGFHRATIGKVPDWAATHKWCNQQFGSQHYTWTGSVFWFENEKDAIIFALKWS